LAEPASVVSASSRTGRALIWRTIQLGGVKLIFLARVLVLGRLLAPDDFGLLAISVVAVGFLLSVTDLSLIPALVQRDRPDEGHYHAAWTAGLTRGLLVTGALAIGAPLVAQLFGEPRATDFIRVLAVRPLIQAAGSVRVADLNRELRFRSLAMLYLTEAVVNTLVSLGLVQQIGVGALVAGPLAGALAMSIASYIVAPYRPRLSLEAGAFRPLIRYGQWLFLATLISIVGSQGLQLVISRRLGAEALGIYFLSARLAFLPFEVSSQVVGSVAFPLYAGMQRDLQRASRSFRAMIVGLLALIVPSSLFIVLLIPELVHTVLGPRWTGTIPVIQVLALVNVATVVWDAAMPAFKGMGAPHNVALVEFTQTALLVGLAWPATDAYGVVGAAWAWLIACSAGCGLSAWLIQGTLDRPFLGVGMPLIAVIAASAIGGAAAWGVDRVVAGLPGLTAAGVIGTLATAAALWALDRRWQLGLLRSVSQLFPGAAAMMRVARV
jgi:PST family polysaccharide transporter/lipopolysaccharide exporter